MTMAASVEARVPFLDHHLVEYASGISVDRKIERGTGKLVLKRALEKVLPKDVLYSKKRGFGAPIREWFRGESGEMLVSRLMNSPLRQRNFFDYSFIAQLVEEHRREARDWSFHLWCLLNLSLWYERWIEKS
jgi:asparagine synthase (glutamine-hydrolysing)